MKITKLWIPLPPSVNGLYPGKERRYKSDEYKSWILEATRALNQQQWLPIKGGIEVIYRYGRPDKRRRDVFNMEKATSDILVSSGIIEDDCLIERAAIEWADITGCEIFISALKMEQSLVKISIPDIQTL